MHFQASLSSDIYTDCNFFFASFQKCASKFGLLDSLNSRWRWPHRHSYYRSHKHEHHIKTYAMKTNLGRPSTSTAVITWSTQTELLNGKFIRVSMQTLRSLCVANFNLSTGAHLFQCSEQGVDCEFCSSLPWQVETLCHYYLFPHSKGLMHNLEHNYFANGDLFYP